MISKVRQEVGISKRPAQEPPKAHHTILSSVATGGSLKGGKFEFADGLNRIIGGRGTGKATI